MSDIKMRTILLGLLLFLIVTGGMSSFYSDFFVKQGVDDIENLSSVETMTELKGQSETVQNRTLSEEPQSWTDKVQVLWTQFTDGVNMIFGLTTMPINIMGDVYATGNVGQYLPRWLKIAIQTAIFIIVTFVFISAVRRWKM